MFGAFVIGLFVGAAGMAGWFYRGTILDMLKARKKGDLK